MFSHSSQPPASVKYLTFSGLFGPRTNVAIGTTATDNTSTSTTLDTEA